MKHEFFGQIFEKYMKFKFHENPLSGSHVVSCGQADITKLMVSFCNFVDAPKKWHSTQPV
jgi:hypothetical protein